MVSGEYGIRDHITWGDIGNVGVMEGVYSISPS